jgi:signal transduction histidine kinase
VGTLGCELYHARLHAEESRLVEELKAVDQVKPDFLAMVSHEMRTRLTSIAGYVELLEDGDGGPLLADGSRGQPPPPQVPAGGGGGGRA